MKRLVKALNLQEVDRPPFWMMRQAGRSLPEYRALRQEAGGFLDLCYNPDFAAEVTLQPLRRFGMDAAILFSDILVIPQALGQDLTFEKGEGPKLPPISVEDIPLFADKIPSIDTTLSPIYETVKKVKAALTEEQTLIGFCGAPWTVSTYMIEGGGSKNYAKTTSFSLKHPKEYDQLIDILIQSSVHYLSQQIKAGAEAVQIFDSWASVHSPEQFERLVLKPLLKMAKELKKIHPETPIILFPRGIHPHQLEMFAAHNENFEGLGLDTTIDLAWAHEKLQGKVCIQGNLDPNLLLTTPEIIQQKVKDCLDSCSKKPGYIFNLGHGVLPETPMENLEALVKTVKEYRS